jgi:RNA polymerase sigma-70 factor (ECF subfamily)
MANDAGLILQLQTGDLEALGMLYDRHKQLVFRTALGITGDTDAAADLLQDVFLRLYRFIRRFDSQRPIEPWLYRMTANLAYTWVRRHRWLRPLEDVMEWFAGDRRGSPAYMAELDEENQTVQQAISTLPIAQRIVVVLYYIDDLSLQEIAEILEVPEGTVKSRLHYGRQALKNRLGLQGADLPDMQYEFT